MAYNKYRSRRFWIALWAMVTVTALMGLAAYRAFDPSWMSAAVSFLLGIIGAYVGIESWNKPKMKE